MAFHDVRFPAALSFGAMGGPERRTDIVTLANGHEERNSPWAHSRRRYNAGMGLRAHDDLAHRRRDQIDGDGQLDDAEREALKKQRRDKMAQNPRFLKLADTDGDG